MKHIFLILSLTMVNVASAKKINLKKMNLMAVYPEKIENMVEQDYRKINRKDHRTKLIQINIINPDLSRNKLKFDR